MIATSLSASVSWLAHPPPLELAAMIRTPAGFDPSLKADLDDDCIAHVFVRDSLVLFGDSPGALPWRFYRGEGLRAARVHGIGRHEGRSHVAVALDDDVSPRSLPAGLKAAGLRNWFGVIDDATLAIAMRAVQVLEWDRTHRFCGACGTPTEQADNERAKKCPSWAFHVWEHLGHVPQLEVPAAFLDVVTPWAQALRALN